MIVNSVTSSWVESVVLYGEPVKLKLDTGAQISVLPSNMFAMLKCQSNVIVRDSQCVLLAFGNNKVVPKGSVELLCLSKNV